MFPVVCSTASKKIVNEFRRISWRDGVFDEQLLNKTLVTIRTTMRIKESDIFGLFRRILTVLETLAFGCRRCYLNFDIFVKVTVEFLM